MCKSKKFMAIALVATMVFGSSLTAFAEDPVTSGGSDGSGASEGHLEKKVLNVILPTTTGVTPFNYTMDPERLIRATDGAKYAEGTTFPAEATDTGVYFLTAANTYANESNALTVTNKSSCDVTLSVKVKATATAGGKDIALAESSTVATTGDPNLYLGLKVGDETTVVSATEQTVTTTIAGLPDNFETTVETVDSNKVYAYKEISGASGWKTKDISLEGAVSNLPVATDTTAPTVNVTWSYAEAPTDAAPSITTTEYTVDGTADAAVTVNLGAGTLAATGISEITFKSTTGAVRTLDANLYSLAGTTLTISKEQISAWVGAGVTSREYTIKFNDTAETTKTITMNKSNG